MLFFITFFLLQANLSCQLFIWKKYSVRFLSYDSVFLFFFITYLRYFAWGTSSVDNYSSWLIARIGCFTFQVAILFLLFVITNIFSLIYFIIIIIIFFCLFLYVLTPFLVLFCHFFSSKFISSLKCSHLLLIVSF